MEYSEDIKEIAKALNKLQAEMEFAVKEVQAFKYKYADLAAIWNVLKEPLTRNGLMVTQDAFSEVTGASVQTMIVHAESGQWIKSRTLTVPGGDKTAHGCGSSITYGKRYQLCALLGIQVDDDDDGQAAQKESAKPDPKPKKIPPMTEEQLDAWTEKWSEKYDLLDLQDYCEARAGYFEHSVNQTCAELALLKDDKIISNIDKWLSDREAESK